MLKRLAISTMALAALAVATPAVSLARDRDDHRGGERHEFYRGRDWDHDRHGWGFRFGYRAPVPAPAPGYYDQFRVWHPYTYYPNAPYPNGY